MLNSLGGVQLLFPILEQVDYPVKDRDCDGTERVGLLEYNPKIPSLHGTKMQPHQSFCNFDGGSVQLEWLCPPTQTLLLFPQRQRVWLHFFDSSSQ